MIMLMARSFPEEAAAPARFPRINRRPCRIDLARRGLNVEQGLSDVAFDTAFEIGQFRFPLFEGGLGLS